MNPLRILIVEILPATAALSIALSVARLLMQQFGLPAAQGRFHTIDGLRGYLAFMVFLHHSSIWYFFLRSGQWTAPSSKLYTYFGAGSVDLFFMITAFLFWSKLIDSRSKRIDWLRLYVSRVLRLCPLYFVVVLLLLLIVGFNTGFHQRDSGRHLLAGIFKWVAFTVQEAPDINGFLHTKHIVAGVTWSLPFEWWFYFSLPVFGLLFSRIKPKFWLLLSIAGTAAGVYWAISHSSVVLFAAFLGGILAAFLVRYDRFRALVSGLPGSIVCLIFLASAAIFYPSADTVPGLALVSVGFVIIACGNNLFGVLSWPASRMLGEITYSIYLLHGLLYFVTFRYVIGFTRASEFSLAVHWMVVLLCTPVLVLVSYFAFRTIELPAMAAVPAVTAWLQFVPKDSASNRDASALVQLTRLRDDLAVVGDESP